VIAHNESYHITYFKKKFDDQYAYTDYAYVVKGLQEVAVDYHQQLLASFSIHAPGDPYEDGWPFSCRWVSLACVSVSVRACMYVCMYEYACMCV